jgi:alpha-beta hydrolase superfamily lysophospholipase
MQRVIRVEGGAMSATASDPTNAQTIVLIHGMWMTPLSWEHWAERYRNQGHTVVAEAWPGLEGEPEQLRRDPCRSET